MATPFLIMAARPLTARLGGPLSLETVMSGADSVSRRNHAVVVGYGLAGRYLARMLTAAGIECVVIEANPELVRQARADGLAAVYDDGTRRSRLEHAGADGARLVVFAISSPFEERQGVAAAHELALRATIVVRTRYVKSIDDLMELGATHVVVEEFEASLDLRQTTGAVQVAVIRNGEPRYQREPDFAYQVGDTAVLVGDREALDAAGRLFRGD